MPTRPTRPSRSAKKPAKTTKGGKAAKGAKPARPARPAKAPRLKRPAPERGGPIAANAAADARSRERANAVAQAALAKKAEDVVLIDVRGLTSIADFFVVMSGTSAPQLRAIAESIEVELKKKGAMPLSVEGQGGGSWLLIDYGDVVAHVFEAEQRGFYDLEGLWADAPRESVVG